MRVSLLEHTDNPEKAIAVAARLCYAPISAEELEEKIQDKEIDKLLNILLSSGHFSAVEHASFSFSVEGISRSCSHQIVRHRMASYNQQSQRYVAYKDKVEHITPLSIKDNPIFDKKFEELFESTFSFYKELLESGIDPEDARYILPQAVETKMIITMNARELLHFFHLRCCNRAQWEIRNLADEMLKLVKKVAPRVFKNAGPSCLKGPCPEGDLSCGKPRRKELLGTESGQSIS